jgi:GxxExxY protein
VELDDITGAVLKEAIRIHQRPGPGLLEGVYERLLERGLQRRGLCVESQLGIDFTFDDIDFKGGFRIDQLVEKRVIVEVKSVERGLAPVHTKQLLTYLRLTDLQIGLLLNFGGATMKEGIKRVVNDLPPSASPELRVNREE